MRRLRQEPAGRVEEDTTAKQNRTGQVGRISPLLSIPGSHWPGNSIPFQRAQLPGNKIDFNLVPKTHLQRIKSTPAAAAALSVPGNLSIELSIERERERSGGSGGSGSSS